MNLPLIRRKTMSGQEQQGADQSPAERPRTRNVAWTAAQKAEAVLKVWAQASTPSRICREMNITWTILNHWQQRAMEGMLQALEPYVQLDKGQALSPRLQELIRKRSSIPKEKLTARLRRLEKKELTGG
jgi:transposase-like protein